MSRVSFLSLLDIAEIDWDEPQVKDEHDNCDLGVDDSC